MPANFDVPDQQNPGEHRVYTATIANGASESETVDLWELALVGIQMPAAWTAASLTLLGSADGVTFGQFRDKDGVFTVTSPAAGEFIGLDAGLMMAVRYIKLKSGTLAAAVAQGGQRLVKLVGREM